MTFGNNGYSEKIKEIFDKESLELVNEALKEAKSLLLKSKGLLDNLVGKLMAQKSIYGPEFEKLIKNYIDTESNLDSPSSEEYNQESSKCFHDNCEGCDDCNV